MHVEVSPGGPGYILSSGRGGFFPLPPLRTRARDVEDYRQAFGEDPPKVGAVAIMTDTDNTGEQAVAWYGAIRFLPRVPDDPVRTES